MLLSIMQFIHVFCFKISKLRYCVLEFYQPAFKHKLFDMWEINMALKLPIFLRPKHAHLQLWPAFFGLGAINLMNFSPNSSQCITKWTKANIFFLLVKYCSLSPPPPPPPNVSNFCEMNFFLPKMIHLRSTACGLLSRRGIHENAYSQCVHWIWLLFHRVLNGKISACHKFLLPPPSPLLVLHNSWMAL